MAYRSHISSTPLSGKKSGKSGTSKPSSGTTLGRVLHVVLTPEDPYCTSPDMVNGVYYNPPTIQANETEISKFPFAYPGQANIKTLPLPGEMITLSQEASQDTLTNPTSTRTYWTGIVNIWNNPQHGGAPETVQPTWKQTLLGDFPEQKNTTQLLSNPGDTLIQGRLGQSIRLTGAQGTLPFIDQSNNGQPVIMLRTREANSSANIENIDTDNNSIYLVADHKIPLTPANTKRDSYDNPPVQSDQYKGNQVLVNGGRLYFNAKEESILLSAKESVGINSKTVNLDGKEYMCLDADKIYLGVKARTAPNSTKQPAVLGKQFEFWITQLLDSLTIVADAMSQASAVGAGPVSQLNATGPVLKASISSLKSQLKRIQSKKVYIE